VKLNGTYRIGWFQGNCDYLHGYGLKVDSKSKIEGLFERDERKEKEQLLLYETDDLIA